MKKFLSDSRILKLLMLSLVLTSVLSFGIMQIIASSTHTPGSNQDPIVTKSYVDMKIQEALSTIALSSTATASTGQTTTSVDVTALEKKIADLEKKLISLESELFYSTSNFSGELQKAKYSLVQLSQGHQLLLGEGAEMIIRSGHANAISGPGGNMSNLTTGLDVINGARIEANNIVLSSRNDGRGLVVISETVLVMIKGSYKVQ